MSRTAEFGYEALGAGKRAASDVTGAVKSVAHAAVHPVDTYESLKNVEWSKVPANIAEKIMEDVKGYALAPRPQTPEEAEKIGGSTMGVVEDIFGAKAAGEAVLGASGAVAGLKGASSKASEASAKALEKAGIKLEARQVRASKPESSPGFRAGTVEQNQKIQNKTMGQDTGRIAEKDQQLTSEFIKERKKSLGDHYSKIFTKDRQFMFPQDVIDKLRDFYSKEASIGPAGASMPKRTAANILNHVQRSTDGKLSINGEGLQRLRTDLNEAARSATDSANKNAIHELSNLLDDTIEANHPELKPILSQLNKQYRATKALDELEKAGAIKNGDISGSKAGAFLRQHPRIGTDAQREFAQHAENVKLQSRWEPSGGEEGAIKKGILKTAIQVVNIAPRTPQARAIQRWIAKFTQEKGEKVLTTAENDELAKAVAKFTEANTPPSPPPGPMDNLPMVP
jgi:hypothetical protein